MEAEALRKDSKPRLSTADAAKLAQALFRRSADRTPKPLDSYDDANFYFKTHDGAHYVLKVHNAVESCDPAFIEAQNAAMRHIRSSTISTWCPVAVEGADGAELQRTNLTAADGTVRCFAVRCLEFLPARLQGDVAPTEALLRDVGACTARVAVALASFDHPAAHRKHMWDLRHTLELEPTAEQCFRDDDAQRDAILDVFAEFRASVLPAAASLRRQVLHADANDQNVLVDERGERVVGLIDFGDMVHTWLVCELAIVVAYALITLEYEGCELSAVGTPLSPLQAARAVCGGFTSVLPLTAAEWRVLPTLVGSRLAMSLTLGAFSAARDPTNEYLKLTLRPGLAALVRLRSSSSAELESSWRRCT